MLMRRDGLTAALALCALLGACDQTAQHSQPVAGSDGGYGPFGADAPQQPTPTMAAPTMAQEIVISGAGGGAPPEFQTLITGYLDSYSEQMASGWPRAQGVADAVTGLSAGSEHRWQVRLSAGVGYAFIGACDNECSDVDLILEDENGVQVDTDVLPDDYPLVEVTPRSDGVYTARIVLKSCSIGPCYVGARLLRRP
jgi:hypothetical protein